MYLTPSCRTLSEKMTTSWKVYMYPFFFHRWCAFGLRERYLTGVVRIPSKQQITSLLPICVPLCWTKMGLWKQRSAYVVFVPFTLPTKSQGVLFRDLLCVDNKANPTLCNIQYCLGLRNVVTTSHCKPYLFKLGRWLQGRTTIQS